MRGSSERRREAELIGFIGDIKGGVEVIATRVGSVDLETFTVPQDIESVCFLDLRNKDEILGTPLVEKYFFIKDSLETDAGQNIFLITNDILGDTFYEESICFENYPYHQCVDASLGTIDLFLEGLGSCTTIFTNYSGLISDNKRNISKYEKIDNGGFLAKDEENHANYRDLLQLVPLAFVNSREGEYRQYPYLAYYAKDGVIDDTAIINIMNEKSIDTVIIFRGGIPDPDGYPADGKTVIDDTLDNYFSYWDIIYDVSIIGNNNEDGALITALFAAFTNTPLIFINSGNLGGYSEFLKGKNINVVDYGSMDSDVKNYIKNAPDINARYFDSDDLRILKYNRILNLDAGIIIPIP